MGFNLTFHFSNGEFCQTYKKPITKTNKKTPPITFLLELFVISELEEQILGIIVYGNTVCSRWQ